MKRTKGLVVRAAFAFVLATGVASAQKPAEKDAEAERLFREGQKLMEAKRFGEACPKFEAAYTKDQQLGTLLNLAYCHKQQGAIWQAWLEFNEAEVKAVAMNRKDRRDFARQRMAELEKSLSRVVIDPPSKVELTEVLVEDRRVFEAEKSAPFAVEPGTERKFTFVARGKKPATSAISVPPQKRGDGPLHVTVPEMEDEAKEPPVVAAPPPAKVAPPPPPPPRSPHAGAWRTVGWVGVGVGVPVLVAGSVLGVLTLGSDCKTQARQSGDGCADASKRADASTIAAYATVGVIAGAALSAGGLGILLFGPKASTKDTKARDAWVTPDLAPGWAGLHGAF